MGRRWRSGGLFNLTKPRCKVISSARRMPSLRPFRSSRMSSYVMAGAADDSRGVTAWTRARNTQTAWNTRSWNTQTTNNLAASSVKPMSRPNLSRRTRCSPRPKPRSVNYSKLTNRQDPAITQVRPLPLANPASVTYNHVDIAAGPGRSRRKLLAKTRRHSSGSDDDDDETEIAPFVVAGALGVAAGDYLTHSDADWTDAETDSDEDENKPTAKVGHHEHSEESDYDEVDAKPEGKIGPIWFKNLQLCPENQQALTASVTKNKTLEWMAFHQTELKDDMVASLCEFLEKNTTLKTLTFETAVFSTSELSAILLALSKDPQMTVIKIKEPIGDECIPQMCKYIAHSLPVTMRSITPRVGETNRIEISGRNDAGKIFVYMTKVHGKKTFKKYT